MTEQNGNNKDEQRKSWDELRQSILEVEAAPYGDSMPKFMETAVADFPQLGEQREESSDVPRTQTIPDRPRKTARVTRLEKSKNESHKLQQNIVKIAGGAAALVCTIVVLKGVTNVVQAAYVGKQPHTANVSVSANVVQAVKEVQQKEAKQQAKAEEKKQAEAKAAVQKDYTVCIDAGHGGKDRGCNVGSREEAEDVLLLAQKLKKQLEADGVKVIMTRDTDDYITLEQRVAIANDAKVDYFVSVHRNQGDGNGVETWISSQPSEEGKTLGENIHTAITDVGVQRDRGLKQGSQSGAGNYYVIRCSQMPACLIELGFVNNDTDNKNFDKKGDAYAEAIAKGIEQTAAAYGKDQTASKSDTEAAEPSEEKKDTDSNTKGDTTQNPENTDSDTKDDTTKKVEKKQSFDALDGTNTGAEKSITTDNLKKTK